MRKATLADIADGFLRAATAINAPSSVEAKAIDLRKHILPVLGSMRLEELDGVAVAMFASGKLSDGMRPKTVNNVLSTLRRVLCYAVDRGYAASVPLFPWQGLPKKTRDNLTNEEKDRLSQACEGEWRVAMELAFTGLKLGDLLGLRWSEVGLDGGRVRLKRTLVQGRVSNPVGGRPRTIYLSPRARRALREHGHDRGALVLCTPQGTAWTADQANRALWAACTRAGLPRLGWEALRPVRSPQGSIARKTKSDPARARERRARRRT